MNITQSDINHIARLAHGMPAKKRNKAAAWSAVHTLLTAPDDLSDGDLAALYGYFAPKPPKAPKTPEQWIALAMAKDDSRYYLNYVYSDGGRLIATDGHRLHLWKTDHWPAGYYDANMIRVQDPEFAQFPDVDRVIPADSTTITSPKDWVRTHGLKTEDSPVDVVILEDIAVNVQYFDAALTGFQEPVIHSSNKTSAIKIVDAADPDKLAVIMPWRL